MLTDRARGSALIFHNLLRGWHSAKLFECTTTDEANAFIQQDHKRDTDSMPRFPEVVPLGQGQRVPSLSEEHRKALDQHRHPQLYHILLSHSFFLFCVFLFICAGPQFILSLPKLHLISSLLGGEWGLDKESGARPYDIPVKSGAIVRHHPKSWRDACVGFP